MYKELTEKFNIILNRIIHCINEFIENNIKNPSLVESKLLLINNYIIDILSPTDALSSNIKILSQNKDNDKSISNSLISSSEYIKGNKTIIKYKNNNFIANQAKNNRVIYSYNYNDVISENKIDSYDNKYRITKIKRKLRNKDEKSRTKKLPNLQRLLELQKEVYLYEFQKNKEKENSYNDSKYLTKNNNSFKKRYISDLNEYKIINNNSKLIKHSISQCQIKNSENKIGKNNYDSIKLKYELYRKNQSFKKNNFIKYNFGEIKKSIKKEMDKIKGINLNYPLSFKKTKINNV